MSSMALESSALDSARRKVYLRALPLLFVCYIIAYIDRTNISVAQLNMPKSLPEFTPAVLGFGAGIFFLGYFLLEIPGTLIVERWSASKWICRIMITWGLVASLTAFVTKPWHFYTIRFLLGLAEAGFFPGVIVYLTHWFPKRDRARALSIFLIASPIAMIIGNYLSGLMLPIGEGSTPPFMGLKGWQVIFVVWGIPAVLLGVVVVVLLTDRPKQAKWLTDAERDALEGQLAKEKAEQKDVAHLSVMEGLTNPNVLMLAAAYFGVVTGNYGVEMFLPSILEDWYGYGSLTTTKLAIIPSCLVIIGQLYVGWSSDHFHERRWHAILPIVFGAFGLVGAALTQGNVVLTILCFTIAAAGMKSYMPAFWALPNMYLTAAAAAGSIGLINSFGNLGGWLGPTVIGKVKELTGAYDIGIYFIATTSIVSASIIYLMPVIHRRLSGEFGRAGRLQVLTAMTVIVLSVFFVTSYWVGQQLKPWGPARVVEAATAKDAPAYLNELADSMDEWFNKQTKIRDALKFRLNQLVDGLTSLAKKPPSQLSEQQQDELRAVMAESIEKINAFKKELDKKDDSPNKRYIKPVSKGVEEASELVRSIQTKIRDISKSS